MNLIAFRQPTHIYQSNSCPYGLGGYSHKGFAWRYELQEEHRFRALNNLLKFFISIITPWIDLINKRLRPGDCAHSMTDSTTSAGWMKKTNFSVKKMDTSEATVRLEIARQHASHFTNYDIKEYSQWFPGRKNNAADSLSRDFHPDDAEITKHLHSSFPSQLPPHFQVVPLPKEIESWLTSLLLQLPVKEQLREPHTKTKPELTNDGWNTSIQSDSHMTPTSTGLPDANATSSFVHLLQQSEMDNFQAILLKPWLQEQSEIPFQVYAQPSGKTVNLTHPKTRIFNLVSFYNDFTDHTQTTIPNKNSKKPSPSASSQNSQNEKTPNCSEQSDSSPPLQFSSPCNHANTSKSPRQRNDEPRSSASATSVSSKTEN